jgi:hypothetical protein
MVRAKLVASIALLSTLLIGPPALAAQAAITSKAELTRYLHDTRPGTSPLDRLSPGGRKRFLAQLQFGDHGLQGFSLADPQNELTQPQMVQLLGLFGAEKYATAEGLTPAEQSRRERERASDAEARGCAVETCPESIIEQRFDELILHQLQGATTDARRASLVSQHYNRLFSSYQLPERLRSVSDPDLRLLKRAVDEALFHVPDETHAAQLQMDLAELQRRNMIDGKDYASLYRAMLASRRFAEATALARKHTDMNVEAVPTLRENHRLPQGWPTALTVDAQGGTMIRQAFDMSAPLRIVVVASCHFSQDAARAIEADTQLRPVFTGHAIWLAAQGESLDAAIDWNRKFPDQPIHVAWQDNEWSMLDSWAMPTFYIFRHGQLVKKFSGWEDANTLKQSLREGGVLQ